MYSIHLMQCIMEEVAGRASPELMRELRLYRTRIEEVIERERLYGATPEIQAERNEIFHNFQTTVEKAHLWDSHAWDNIEERARFRVEFDGLSAREKEERYWGMIANSMQSQLRSDHADDVKYVPLHAQIFPYGESRSGDANPRRSRRTRLVERITGGTEAILVIRGMPGTGKSVVARKVVRAVATSTSRDVIPVLALLGRFYPPDKRTIEEPDDWVIEQIQANLNTNKDMDLRYAARYIGTRLPSLLAEGRCFLVFDGMDELPKDDYDKTCRALLRFAQRFTEKKQRNRFIITCREFDYPKELLAHTLVILPFEWHDVRYYLKNHLPPPDFDRVLGEMAALWRERSSARELLDNPFFLNLLTQYLQHQSGDRIRLTRGHLLNSYVERVRRTHGANGAEADDNVLERLALQITATKISGTTISWSSLQKTPAGSSLAETVRQREAGPSQRYFLDIDNSGVTFRHHRLREFFAAKALARLLRSHAADASDNWLRKIASDIWYYEVLVLMASLLDGQTVQRVTTRILRGGDEQSVSPYRALLAADCLEASEAQHNTSLMKQVFDALKLCIRSDNTTDVDRVACWQALGRLEVGGVDLSELPAMLDKGSRFVREEAMATIGRLGSEPIPACRRVAWGLLGEAAQLGALDRLYRYWPWLMSPPLRNVSLFLVGSQSWSLLRFYGFFPFRLHGMLQSAFFPRHSSGGRSRACSRSR